MSAFTTIVIMGVLMIIGGISLLATPLMNFLSAGYFIIILFFVRGIFGIIWGIHEKQYGQAFIFSILSLILGIIGFVVPGAAAMNNYVMLYMAAAWFFIHGILSIVTAIGNGKQGAGTGATVLGIALGVLELLMGAYSVAHPMLLAVGLGLLISFYFIESGVNAIIIGMATCTGGNSLTVLFTVMGILTIIGGISMLATPLITFLGAGHCIIMLFFINGVLGVVRAVTEKRYDKAFFFALLSLILGIVGFAVPGIAELNNSILLYMAAGWFIFHGILSIVTAIENRKLGASFGVMLIGILLGALELIMGIYSAVHPAILAVSLGILISFYFIESGLNMIFIGSAFSTAVAISRAGQIAEANDTMDK